MKLPILLLFLASATVNAADEPGPLTKSMVQHKAQRTVSQQFEDADIGLAITQYKRLKELAFELGLRLQLEEIKDAERDALARRIEVLNHKAQELRSEVEAKANTSAPAK